MIERPLELLALVAFVATLGVLALAGGRRTLVRQAVIALAIGLGSAAFVLSQYGDLVPDGLEPLVLAGSVIALGGVALLAWRFRRAGPQ